MYKWTSPQVIAGTRGNKSSPTSEACSDSSIGGTWKQRFARSWRKSKLGQQKRIQRRRAPALSLGGSLTDQRNSSNSSWLIDARELNLGLSLDFPTLLLPSSWLPTQSRKWSPKTTLSARTSYQFRANEFNRLNITSGIEYSWRVGKAFHRVTPYNLSLVQIDINTTNTPFLFLGFQDLVFSGSSYSFNDSWQHGKDRTSSLSKPKPVGTFL